MIGASAGSADRAIFEGGALTDIFGDERHG